MCNWTGLQLSSQDPAPSSRCRVACKICSKSVTCMYKPSSYRIVSCRIVLLWKNGPVLTPCSRSSLHWGSSSIIFFLSPSLRSSISGYSLKGFSFLSVGKYGCAVNLPPWLRRRVLVHFGVYFRTWCSMDSVSWETLAYFSFGRLQHILVKNPLVM